MQAPRINFSALFWRVNSTVSSTIIKILLLAEIFLFLRLVLRYLGADPKAPIIGTFYEYTSVITFPFENIFPDVYWPEGMLIETATISAMVGYIIIVALLFQFFKLFTRD